MFRYYLLLSTEYCFQVLPNPPSGVHCPVCNVCKIRWIRWCHQFSNWDVAKLKDFLLIKMELACKEVSCLQSLYFSGKNDLPAVSATWGEILQRILHPGQRTRPQGGPAVQETKVGWGWGEGSVNSSSNHCRPFWNYQENEPELAYPQVLPAALNLTSLTYTGDRRRHPDLRMRLYEVLQHKA